MTQLTVRGIDEQLHKVLKEKATQSGVSVNHLVLDALKQIAGMSPKRHPPQRYHDLDHLAGTWTVEEYEEFQAALDQLRTVDSELWQSPV